MGGMSLGGGAQALPQMSTALGYTPPLSGALGAQMGGQSLDPKLFNGMVAAPQTTMDLTKLADALKGFSGSSKSPEMSQGAGSVHNKQDDYQQYLNAFNASHKG